MTARVEIAAATTLDGITNVSPYFRQTTRSGEGMVRLERTFRASNGVGFLDVWQVVIFLPQTIAASEEWIEAHLDALLAAANSVLVVTSATPSQIALDSGTVPGLVIEGSREH